MDTYSTMREFADSWVLLALFIFFVAVVLRVIFGKRSKYRDSAEIPFRHEDRPAPDDPAEAERGNGDKEARK